MFDYIGYIVVAIFLIIMSVQDLKNKEISLIMLIIGAGCGLCYRAAQYYLREEDISLYNPNVFLDVIIAVIIAGILCFVAIKSEMIGLGDALAIGMVGIYIGFIRQLIVFTYALLLVCLVSAVLLTMRKIKFKTRLPFIPFVFVANMGVILCG